MDSIPVLLFQVLGEQEDICGWVWSLWFHPRTHRLPSQHTGVGHTRFVPACGQISVFILVSRLGWEGTGTGTDLVCAAVADHPHRQQHGARPERHRIQLRRLGQHLQSHVQRASGDIAQRELHCLRYAEGACCITATAQVWLLWLFFFFF